MYYKIISGGQIVDACDSLNYVRWQEKNRLFLSCAPELADGLIASGGADIYLLEGSSAGNILPDALTVTVMEISQDDYESIRQQLADNDMVEEPAEQAGQAEAVAKSALLKRVEELEQQNEMLLECLLEMSEVVYAE